MPTPHRNERADAIRRAYEDGQLVKNICADFAISRATFYRIIGGSCQLRQKSNREAILADLAHGGATKADIARKHDVHWLTVHRASETLVRLNETANALR